MPKKKNKQNHLCNQKIQAAQHRNDYFKKLSIFLKKVTGEDVLAMLPENEKEILYLSRGSLITAEAEEGHEISPDIANFIKALINNHLKNTERTIERTGMKVSLADYNNFFFPLHFFYKKPSNSKSNDRIKELLKDEFETLDKFCNLLCDEIIDTIFQYLLMSLNRCSKYYYSFLFDLKELGSFRMKYIVKVTRYSGESMQFNLNGTIRTAYRVGWTFKENCFKWVNVTPAQLGIKSSFGNLPIPVYIQMHALDRLLQRADCINFIYLNYCIYLSLKELNVIHVGDTYLIEFYIGVKIGYFVANLTEGQLVIRTFLFLTCKGTPEGNRLEETTGLQILDSKYLGMDKLSTFMSLKANKGTDLYSIFEKADCLHLLELSEKLKNYMNTTCEKSSLELITDYLKTNGKEKEIWTEEGCLIDDF